MADNWGHDLRRRLGYVRSNHRVVVRWVGQSNGAYGAFLAGGLASLAVLSMSSAQAGWSARRPTRATLLALNATSAVLLVAAVIAYAAIRPDFPAFWDPATGQTSQEWGASFVLFACMAAAQVLNVPAQVVLSKPLLQDLGERGFLQLPG